MIDKVIELFKSKSLTDYELAFMLIKSQNIPIKPIIEECWDCSNWWAISVKVRGGNNGCKVGSHIEHLKKSMDDTTKEILVGFTTAMFNEYLKELEDADK